VSAEAFGGLDAGPGDAGHDAALAESSAVLGGVVRLVGRELSGASSALSAPGADGGCAADQRPQGVGVADVRAGRGHRQRHAAGIGQDMELAAALASVDRVRAGQRAPFSWGMVSPGPRGAVGDADERSDYRLAWRNARPLAGGRSA
jgi:hypothetical protein